MNSLLPLPLVIGAFLGLGAFVTEAPAQAVPYKAKGTGFYTPVTGDYGGQGTGTHLGRHTFAGNVAVFPTGDPLVFTFQSTSPQQTVAANGDILWFTSSGSVQLTPLDSTFTTFTAVWTGDFVVAGGTGRFADSGPADQPLKGVAINDPFSLTDPVWTFSWTLEGKIVLH
jgi:hypothetical protein